MKTKGRYLKAKYEDRIVFTSEKELKPRLEVTEIWKKSQGVWREHPIFRDMSIKEVIEWLRGEDSGEDSDV